MFQQEIRTKVKICGLTTLEDARFASGALADYLGFIFYDKSPRFIEPGRASAIISWIEGPKKVGVFVNQPLDEVNDTARLTGIDLVQLHGTESPEYCQLIQLPVIKVLHVEENTTVSELEEMIGLYSAVSEYLLFDTKSDTKWGGTGRTFDWELIRNQTREIPFILSGGLNSGNIRLAIETTSPDVVDLSSGLEESPGLKCFDKMELFFEEMRKIRDQQESA
ncbi:MAG: phosphoribosylanthranilate isomerase [Balneolaceae bacterium]|nr:MAG: phosphoribosylanthranilate isomerase [Balneolaceae bacterium]